MIMKSTPMKQLVESVKINILLIAVFGLFVAGCGKCEDCELNGNTETICESDFDNTDQYEGALADQEADGATCTSVGGF